MQTDLFLLALLWCYIGATLWQLLICCGIFARFARYPKEKNRLQERQKNRLVPSFSLIICARNEAENLRLHLPAVLEQKYAGEWELLLVDDASTDGTPALIRSLQEQYPQLKYLRLNEKAGSGKKYALEKGIAAGRYDHLLLTDADCEPAGPFWLDQMAIALTRQLETEIVLGYGPMKETGGMLNRWVRFETAHTAMQYFSFALAGLPYMGVGRNLGFKKQAFKRVGGFEEHLHIPSGDDDLLVNAAGTRRNTVICTVPETFVFSEGKTTVRNWLLQKRRHLRASSAYHPAHQGLLASISLSQVFHYFFLLMLLLFSKDLLLPLSLYVLRISILFWIYRSVFSTLRCKDLLAWFPLLDVLLTVYYGIFVPLYLLTGRKKLAWK